MKTLKFKLYQHKRKGASQFRKNTDEEFQNPYAALTQNGISAKVGCSPKGINISNGQLTPLG